MSQALLVDQSHSRTSSAPHAVASVHVAATEARGAPTPAIRLDSGLDRWQFLSFHSLDSAWAPDYGLVSPRHGSLDESIEVGIRLDSASTSSWELGPTGLLVKSRPVPDPNPILGQQMPTWEWSQYVLWIRMIAPDLARARFALEDAIDRIEGFKALGDRWYSDETPEFPKESVDRAVHLVRSMWAELSPQDRPRLFSPVLGPSEQGRVFIEWENEHGRLAAIVDAQDPVQIAWSHDSSQAEEAIFEEADVPLRDAPNSLSDAFREVFAS